MSGDDLIDNRQPEPGSMFRRLEWNKQAFQVILTDAYARILETDVCPTAASFKTDHEPAALRHRFKRIGCEIVEHLTHHAAVDGSGNRLKPGFDGMGWLKLRTVADEADGLGNQNGQIHRFGFRRRE